MDTERVRCINRTLMGILGATYFCISMAMYGGTGGSDTVIDICRKIVDFSQLRNVLCSHHVWQEMQNLWMLLDRALVVDVRIQVYGVFEAVRKINADVMWIADSCLSVASCSLFEHSYHCSLQLPLHLSSPFSLMRSVSDCCCTSFLGAVLLGTHHCVDRNYFDHPVVHRTGVLSRQVHAIEQAYHALWRRVADEVLGYIEGRGEMREL